jgi:hypothetical protein
MPSSAQGAYSALYSTVQCPVGTDNTTLKDPCPCPIASAWSATTSTKSSTRTGSDHCSDNSGPHKLKRFGMKYGRWDADNGADYDQAFQRRYELLARLASTLYCIFDNGTLPSPWIQDWSFRTLGVMRRRKKTSSMIVAGFLIVMAGPQTLRLAVWIRG